jgi:uncharacterized protein with PIN domain
VTELESAQPPKTYIRFYAELNDHLPAHQQYQMVEKTLITPTSAKDFLESFGVPHTEVDLILVNGVSAGFDRLVQPGDRVSVYPVFESFDIAPEVRVRPQPLRDPKFVLDVHLGRLAAYLRMLGFDAWYRSRATDKELAEVSASQRRILLTRDRGLLKRSQVTHGYWLRLSDSRRQLTEVVGRFDLARMIQPFTRCMACNAPLADIPKDRVRGLIPPRAAESYEEFRRCPDCSRIYWKGSHYRRMESWIRELRDRRGWIA